MKWPIVWRVLVALVILAAFLWLATLPTQNGEGLVVGLVLGSIWAIACYALAFSYMVLSEKAQRKRVARLEAASRAHTERVLRNQLRVAVELESWEKAAEGTLGWRWECWDDTQGCWRRYWRKNGSLPPWAAP